MPTHNLTSPAHYCQDEIPTTLTTRLRQLAKTFTLPLFLICATEMLAPPSHAALSPIEAMRKNEEVRKFSDLKAHAVLIASGEGRKESKKEFTWWRKLMSDGTLYQTLTRFHAPAEIKNEAVLFLERPESKSEVHLYLPVYKKVRRVESQNQSSSYMGSDFSYADIATPHVDDYTYRFLPEGGCPVGGGQCLQIEGIPVNDAVKDRTKYAKVVTWLDTEKFTSRQMDYYDLSGELLKRLKFENIKLMDSKTNHYFSHSLTMTNLKTKGMTQIEFSEVDVKTSLTNSLFTLAGLASER